MTELPENISRSEHLGRLLLKHYKFDVISLDECRSRYKGSVLLSGGKFAAKPKGKGIYWSDPSTFIFDDWNDLHFSSNMHSSLNDHIKMLAFNWKALRVRIPLLLKYDNLDELDVQLTLIGCNSSVSATA